MHDASPSDLTRLADFIARELDPGDEAATRAWIAADPEREMFVAHIEEARRSAASVAAPGNIVSDMDRHVDLIAQAVAEEIHQTRRTVMRKPKVAHAPKDRRFGYFGGMVAVATLCLAAAGLWIHQKTQVTASGSVADHVMMQEYVTPKGRRATITLTDGSSVVLNVDSRLRVPQTYGRGGRDVYLEGEAQFTVTHHEGRPFTVHSPGTIVRELGTVFGVRAYANEGRTQVIVAQGRVSVTSSAVAVPKMAVLNRGDLATISYDGTTFVSHDASISQHLDWTAGRLVFQNAPIGEVLTQLSRWYDLDFYVTDSALATRRVDLFIPDQTWRPGMLDMLEQTLGVRIHRNGRAVTLSPLSVTE